MELPEHLRQLAAAATRIEVTSATYWCPDEGPPSSSTPMDFAFHAGAGAFSYFTAAFGRHVALDAGTQAALADAARAALRQGSRAIGVDTATGRPCTFLTVLLHDPMQPAPGVAGLCINHYGSRRLDEGGWSALIRLLMGVVGYHVGGRDLSRWLLLYDRLPEHPPLPEPFEHGGAVRCPDGASLLVLPLGEGLYLRAGQSPGASALIELRPRDGGVDVLLLGQGERLLDRVALPKPTSEDALDIPARFCRDLLAAGVERGASYREAPAGEEALRALAGDGSPQFRLAFPDARRVVLSTYRPTLGLYAQRKLRAR